MRMTNVRCAGSDKMRLRNMACLVTGGSGFIGSHLVAALKSQGHRVRVLDNRFPGRGHHGADGVEALVRAVVRFEARGGAYEPLNVCSGRAVTVRRLGETAAQAVGGPRRVEYVPLRMGDFRISLGSQERTRRALGRAAGPALGEGVARTVAAMAESESRPVADRTEELGEPCAAS